MRKYVERRAKEAKEKLGPVLKDLKLALYVETTSRDTTFYFFGKADNRNGTPAKPRSPVTLVFPPSDYIEGKEAQWQDAELVIHDWSMKPLGETGWSHRRRWGAEAFDIEQSGDEMFAWIESRLRENGVVTHVEDKPGIVDSWEVAELYWCVCDVIDDLAIVRIANPEETGQVSREALTFQDYEGRRVHVVPGDEHIIMIDGVVTSQYRCKIQSLGDNLCVMKEENTSDVRGPDAGL